MSMALMSELGLSSWSDFVANVPNLRNRRSVPRKRPGVFVAAFFKLKKKLPENEPRLRPT